MKKNILIIIGVAALASPVAPRGCATVNVGVEWHGKYGTYSATRKIDRNSGEPAQWDVLISSDGKQIKPLH